MKQQGLVSLGAESDDDETGAVTCHFGVDESTNVVLEAIIDFSSGNGTTRAHQFVRLLRFSAQYHQLFVAKNIIN